MIKKVMSMSFSTFPTTTAAEEVLLLDDHLVANGPLLEVLKLSANHLLTELTALVMRETVLVDVMMKAAEDVMMEAEGDAVATTTFARPSRI